MQVVNVVSTADLRQYIELKALNSQTWGRYDRDIYPAGYVKDGDNQGKVTVFHTGKLISVGAKTIPASFFNLTHTKKLLLAAGMIEDAAIKPQVRNMVATVRFGHELDLASIASRAPNVIYEPEIFPGVMIKSRDESTTFLVFATGKVVIAGVKSEAELEGALRRLEKLIGASSSTN